MSTIRILIVDDERLFAETIAVRLAREPGLEVLAVAYDAQQAESLLAASTPDVLVLDVMVGRGRGIAVLDHVRRHYPAVGTVMLTAVESTDRLVEAVRHGATAWLPKTVEGDELVRVIRGAAKGESWIPPELLRDLLSRLVAEPPSASPAVLARLTPREREVFQCMVDGLSRAEIARRLHVSVDTVRAHTQNLLAKLGAHSVIEAVALGMRSGMRPSDQRRD